MKFTVVYTGDEAVFSALEQEKTQEELLIFLQSEFSRIGQEQLESRLEVLLLDFAIARKLKLCFEHIGQKYCAVFFRGISEYSALLFLKNNVGGLI